MCTTAHMMSAVTNSSFLLAGVLVLQVFAVLSSVDGLYVPLPRAVGVSTSSQAPPKFLMVLTLYRRRGLRLLNTNRYANKPSAVAASKPKYHASTGICSTRLPVTKNA